MRVLGALEYAGGSSLLDRYKAVGEMTFRDEDGVDGCEPCVFRKNAVRWREKFA